jgi:hypothetical protein
VTLIEFVSEVRVNSINVTVIITVISGLIGLIKISSGSAWFMVVGCSTTNPT